MGKAEAMKLDILLGLKQKGYNLVDGDQPEIMSDKSTSQIVQEVLSQPLSEPESVGEIDEPAELSGVNTEALSTFEEEKYGHPEETPLFFQELVKRAEETRKEMNGGV